MGYRPFEGFFNIVIAAIIKLIAPRLFDRKGDGNRRAAPPACWGDAEAAVGRIIGKAQPVRRAVMADIDIAAAQIGEEIIQILIERNPGLDSAFKALRGRGNFADGGRQSPPPR